MLERNGCSIERWPMKGGMILAGDNFKRTIRNMGAVDYLRNYHGFQFTEED